MWKAPGGILLSPFGSVYGSLTFLQRLKSLLGELVLMGYLQRKNCAFVASTLVTIAQLVLGNWNLFIMLYCTAILLPVCGIFGLMVYN